MKDAIVPVEVLIFTFNQQDYVAEAIQSVINQITNFDFKIRVHDDHSSDDTVIIARKQLEKSNIPFEIVVQSTNQYQKGMNFFAEAIMESNSEYLALLDGDDLWTDNFKLQKQFDVMNEHSQVSICHHPFGFLRGGQSVLEDWRHSHLQREIVSGEMLGEQNFIGASTVMLRTSCLPSTIPQGYNSLKIGDYPLWALISEGKFIYEINSFMSLYREHETNVFAGLAQAEKYHREFLARAFVAVHVSRSHQKYWIDGLVEAVGSHLGIHSLKTQIQDLTSQLAVSEQNEQLIAEEINALRQSTSWKVTSFLRTLSRITSRNK